MPRVVGRSCYRATRRNEPAVTESLRRLVGIYLKWQTRNSDCGARAGGVFAIAFRKMSELVLAGAIVYTSDDESPENANDNVLNPAGGKHSSR